MEWRECVGFPKYEVSDSGAVRRKSTGRIRKSAPCSAGYSAYGLMRDGAQFTVTAGRLVLEAFVGPKPFDDAQVCHNDGTKTNDSLSNLRWDSVKGNAADRLAHGTETFGEKNGQSKLRPLDVIEIRRLKASGVTQRCISTQFNVAKSVVSDIVNRKLWSHVS